MHLLNLITFYGHHGTYNKLSFKFRIAEMV